VSKLPPDFLRKVKDAVNIVDIIGEHVVLRKSGASHTGLCPFHSERTPSFNVNEQKQLYHCYGCKKGGDLVSFVQEMHGLSFVEAIEELAERARIPLPGEWSGAQSSDDPKVAAARAAAREKLETSYRLNMFSLVYFQQQLGVTEHAKKYLAGRGVDAALIKNFYIGAAPVSWDALAAHMSARKAPMELAVELGLIRPSQKNLKQGSGYFDIFRNRVIFPIIDNRRKVVGFGGRTLPLEKGMPDVGSDGPPYLNSSDTPVFKKQKILFGLFQAQKHIRAADSVIIVEGYFDAIALAGSGFGNVVATCGTALTPDHLQILRRLCSKVIILFDGDRAGVEATERAMVTGLGQGMVVYGASMPEGLDPDEILFEQGSGAVIAGGRERMTTIVESARPIIDDRISEAAAEAARSPEEKSQAIRRVAAWLRQFKDPLGLELRMESFCKLSGVSRQLFNRAMNEDGGIQQAARQAAQGAPNPPPGPPKSTANKPQSGPARISKRERIVLGAFAFGSRFKTILDLSGGNLPPKMTFSDLFDYLPAREFVCRLVNSDVDMARFKTNPADFSDEALDAQVRSIITEAAVSETPPYGDSDVQLALNRCLARVWARFSQEIKKGLAQAEANKDAALQAVLMKEYLDVQRKMKEFNEFYDEG